MNVVFTGPAVTGEGAMITRANLAKACMQKGNLTVQPSVRADTDVLVASRTDTLKAKKAQERGITVLTYPEFINHFLGQVELAADGHFNPYTVAWKHLDKDLLVPDFTDPEELALIDLL